MLNESLSKITSSLHCPGAVIIRDGKILIGLRNYTADKWKNISVWTLPGGRCDLNETIENTLKREAEEEIGITDLKIIDYIGEVAGAKEGDIVPLFLCSTEQGPKLMEPEKFSEWKWVTIEEFAKDYYSTFINPKAHDLIVSYLQNR